MKSFTSVIPDKKRGFSLIELLVTLSIAVILLTAAAPSFVAMVQRDQLITQANDFISTLSLARTEAASRGQRVVVCKSAAPYNTCAGGGRWDQGWIVFTDVDGNDNYTVADDGANGLLRIHEALEGNSTLRGDSDIGNSIAFLSTGFAATPLLRSLSLCDSSAVVANGKNILLLPVGQARVTTAAPASCSP